MFEGSPDFPVPDRLWQVVDRYQITHLGFSPTLVRVLSDYGLEWVDRHDLNSLRILGSTGEPWTAHPGGGCIVTWVGERFPSSIGLAGRRLEAASSLEPCGTNEECRFAGPAPG